MTDFETVDLRIEGQFAHVTLNRPDVKNAINRQLTQDLLAIFTQLKDNHTVKGIVLSGAGGTFCAGGDLNEMRSAFMDSDTSNDSAFEDVLVAVNTAPQVVITKVEGAAMGGGFGLVCVSDIAIASTTAKMGLPEVRLGIAPAFISPYVIQRIGLSRSRELMLTGRRFNGTEAKTYGIVNECVEPDELDTRVNEIIAEVRKCSPNALRATKALIFEVMGKPMAETVEYRANLLSELRRSDDAQEGIMAFMQKRPAKWAVTDEETE